MLVELLAMDGEVVKEIAMERRGWWSEVVQKLIQ
jgi:hypothetical protein